jgi:hypothetical protein
MCPYHGDKLNLCLFNFYYLELPKNDNLILDLSLDRLKAKINCDLALIKILMIRLRRRKNLKDWNLFKLLLENNLDFILNTTIKVQKFNNSPIHTGVRLRWLISLLDTFIDNGNSVESRNAFIVTIFQRNEKIFSTLMDYYDLEKKNNYEFKYDRELCGFHINLSTDLIINYVNRLNTLLSNTPLILKIFKHILNHIMKEKKSLYCRVSEICEKDIFQKPILNFIQTP